MILIDSSIWIDHIRSSDPLLRVLLEDDEVLCHPMITGEILVGNVRNWAEIRNDLEKLPVVAVADHQEVLDFVRDYKLYGIGLSYIDFHLLVSTKLMPSARLWTRDKRLKAVSDRLDLSMTRH